MNNTVMHVESVKMFESSKGSPPLIDKYKLVNLTCIVQPDYKVTATITSDPQMRQFSFTITNNELMNAINNQMFDRQVVQTITKLVLSQIMMTDSSIRLTSYERVGIIYKRLAINNVFMYSKLHTLNIDYIHMYENRSFIARRILGIPSKKSLIRVIRVENDTRNSFVENDIPADDIFPTDIQIRDRTARALNLIL